MSFDNAHSEPEPRRTKPARTGGGFPILGLLALLVALATAGYVVYRDPPWGRLGKYNFSSPEQSMRSDLRMRANSDVLALIELDGKLEKKELNLRLSSLKVDKAVDWQGKTALFIQYKQLNRKTKEEKERKEVVWYEKDDTTGYYKRTFDIDTGELRKTDEKLYKDMMAWNASGMGMGGIGVPGE